MKMKIMEFFHCFPLVSKLTGPIRVQHHSGDLIQPQRETEQNPVNVSQPIRQPVTPLSIRHPSTVYPLHSTPAQAVEYNNPYTPSSPPFPVSPTKVMPVNNEITAIPLILTADSTQSQSYSSLPIANFVASGDVGE
jgi:hypothetical protein